MKSILYLLLAVSIFSACKKTDELPEQIIGTGEIISNAKVLPGLLSIDYTGISGEYMINTASENIYELMVSYDNGLTLDSINFVKYTLLGQYASGPCNVVFERNVFKNVPAKTYKYDVKIYQEGSCESLASSMNWVIIPKMEDGYTVEFKIIEQN